MIRPVLTEIGLFIAPFVMYAGYLLAIRSGVLDPNSWTWRVIASLSIAGLLLVIFSFVVIAHFSGAPPGSQYTPAHMENGKLVPGRSQ